MTAFDVPHVVENITPILAAARCYERRDEMVRTLVPRVRSGLEAQDRPPERDRQRHVPRPLPRHRIARGPAGAASAHGRAEPRNRGRDELQAAHAEDARVLPRRPAQLRRRRHAEPARVRPGLLRQERRRRRRRQADRPPLQVAGVPPCGVPRDSRRRFARGLPPQIPIRSHRARRSSTSRCPTKRWIFVSTRTTPACRQRPLPSAVGLSAENVERVFRDIEQKRRTTRYLHLARTARRAGRRAEARQLAASTRERYPSTRFASLPERVGHPPRGLETARATSARRVGELIAAAAAFSRRCAGSAVPGNRDERRRAVEEPGERDLGRRRVVGGRDPLQRAVPAPASAPFRSGNQRDEGDPGSSHTRSSSSCSRSARL